MNINFQFYPKNIRVPNHLADVVNVFIQNETKISSFNNDLKSNEVLAEVTNELENINYRVEKKVSGKTEYIEVPVLFGRNNMLEKYFRADGYNDETKTVIEVEAGRGVLNNQFLKDLFQACMMQDVDYLVIAVRNIYNKSADFDKVCKFFDALYASDRLILPLKGILVIGY